MEDEKALIKLSEKHERLVKRLKNALKLGQIGFIQAGFYLYKIQEGKTYLAEDSSREITFTEFCARPDLPLPGRTDSSRLRIAQMLLRVYKFYVLEKKFDQDRLAPVGYSKLDLLVPVIKVREKEAEDWIDKATMLSARDLIEEVRLKDKKFAEILECQHKNIEEVIFFRCKDCLTVWKNDPRKEKNVKKK